MGSLFSQSDENRAQLNILCFGASLIAGFYRDWDNWYKDPKTGMPKSVFYSPFSKTLESLIFDNFEINKNELNIVTRGLPGQCAINMIERLNKCLKPDKNIRFDLVVICAGTNDIALVGDTQKIINKIIEMHEICHQHGAKSVIVSIPECEKQNDKVIEKRHQINNSLKEYANENKNSVMFFDLYNKLRFHNLANDKKQLYWSDGLHFTPNGYKYWGEMLYQFLLSWICVTHKQKFIDTKMTK